MRQEMAWNSHLGLWKRKWTRILWYDFWAALRAQLRLEVFNLEVGYKHRVEDNLDFRKTEVLLMSTKKQKGEGNLGQVLGSGNNG